ncbi:hypothetical protein ABVT39_005310 [Epinephelus coioides]
MLLFVLLSLGSTINWGAAEKDPHPPDLVLISLCFGLSIATMVQCFSHISGAHINPAVTAAMVVTRKLSLTKAVFFLLAQCTGAIVGAAILYGITPASVRGSMGITTVNMSISVGNALVVELFITFQLVFTVFATCDNKRSDLKGSSALAIGLSVCIGHLFAISTAAHTSLIFAHIFSNRVKQRQVRASKKQQRHTQQHCAAALHALARSCSRSLSPLCSLAVKFCSLEARTFDTLGAETKADPGPLKIDPELKRRYSEAFIKTPFTANKHRQDSVTAQEPLFTVMDVERAERKEREREREEGTMELISSLLTNSLL